MKRYTSEEKKYMKRLYKEGVKLVEIEKRFEAEFGRKTSTSVISKFGGRKRNSRVKGYYKKQFSPLSYKNPQPAYCSYCGSKLKKGN